jgi:hypothetical protein
MHVMLRKLATFLGLPDPNFPTPPMEEGEEIILEDWVIHSASLTGGRVHRVVLTNHRVMWYDTARVMWPFKAVSDQFELGEIRSVDTGTVLDIVGGRPLRLRLVNGKDKCLRLRDGKPDEWIAAIRGLLASK